MRENTQSTFRVAGFFATVLSPGCWLRLVAGSDNDSGEEMKHLHMTPVYITDVLSCLR